jgi:outer membrane protein assembly factor BamB
MKFFAPILLGLALPVMHAGDWPEFRGPTRDGHSTATNVPIAWSASSNIVWKARVPGSGWSSPVLSAAGKLFLTSAVGKDGSSEQSLRALCFDAANGSVVWDTEVFVQKGGSARIHGKNGHASPTPVLEGDRLYVHFGHQGTAALDLAGKKIWENRSLGYTPVHGNGGSPLIVGDVLFYSADGDSAPKAIALNKRTGKVLWTTRRQTAADRKFSFSTAQLIHVDGRPQIISPASGAVFAYAPEDGRELWRAGYGSGYSVVPRPVFANGLVFVGTGYDQATLIAVRPGSGDVTSSNIAWTIRRSAPHTPSVLVQGDELYFVSDAGVASCADARTGQVHWSERLGGGFSASPVLAEDRIYFQNEEGVGFVVATGKTYRLLARNELGERTLASYAVDDGTILIRSAEHLWRIGR